MVEQVDREEFAKLFKARLINIEKQIAKLQADFEAMKRAESILFEGPIRASLLKDTPPISTELEGLKPTAGIFVVLDSDSDKFWTAAEMGREMKRRGFKPGTENFDSVISSTLFRLAKDERIEKEAKEGEPTRFKKKDGGITE